MKNKLGLTDTIAMVRDLQRFAGMKVINVYNLNRKIYLIRLQNKSMGKRVLLIESGTRMHTTRYSRTKPPMPSTFAMKLRKHIRGKHLNSVTQLGLDRVVVLRFGLGEGAFNVIVELYGQGNIVLTDNSYTVLSLLRVVDATTTEGKEGEAAKAPARGKRGGAKTSKAAAGSGASESAASASSGEGERVWRVGAPYPVAFGARDRGGLTDRIARSLPSVAVVENLEKKEEGGDGEPAVDGAAAAAAGDGDDKEAIGSAAHDAAGGPTPPAGMDLAAETGTLVTQVKEFLAGMAERPAPGRKQRARHTLRSTLAARGSGLEIFGTDLLDHAIVGAGLDPTELVCQAPLHGKKSKGKKGGKVEAKPAGPEGYGVPSEEVLARLAEGLKRLPGMLREIGLSASPTAYIVVKRRDGAALAHGPVAVAEGAGALDGFDDDEEEGEPEGEGEGASKGDGESGVKGGGETSSEGEAAAKGSAGGSDAANASAGAGASSDEPAGADTSGSSTGSSGESKSKQPKDPFAEYDFVEVSPSLFKQHESKAYIPVASFDRALDEYFTRVDAARADAAISGARTAAMARVDRAKADSEKRVGELQAEQQRAGQWGYLIQSNLPQVDATIKTLRSALDSGMNWGDLERLVEAEREKGNPVARAIVSMDLPKRRVTVMLRNWDVEVEEDGEDQEEEEEDSESEDEDGEEEEKNEQEQAFEPVEVSIDLTAPANASEYFQQGRLAREKEERTRAAASETLKRLEKQADKDAEAAVQKAHRQTGVVQASRKKAWWEKFAWFLSTDGLVVVAGKDAHQNEMLVRRYLRPQDLYVHAEIHGAATVIVRSPLFEPEPGAGIPPSTLQQAGAFCICRSAAWKANRPTSAWWVFASQVSKTAQSGEYLTTGSFMIRGKKNFLHPARLELGLAIAFKVDEESALKRLARKPPMRVQLGAVGAREGARDSLTAASAAAPGSEGEARGAAKKGGQAGAASAADTGDVPAAAGSAAEASSGAGKAGSSGGSGSGSGRGDGTPASRGTGMSTESVLAGQALPQIGGRKVKKAEEIEHEKATKAAIQRKTEKLDQAQIERARAARERRKRKKRAKYADQDDEDRLVAMEALGHSTDELRAKIKAEAGEDSNSDGEELGEGVGQGTAPMPEGTTHVVGTKFVVSTADPGEEGPGLGTGAASGAGAGGLLDAPPAASRHQTSGGAAFDDEDEGDVFVQQSHGYTGEELNIGSLVMEPKEGEVLLHAVPVAAPYATVADARYRAKLVPGAGKKGKTAKSVVQQMLGGKVHSGREKDLLRGLKDEELVQVMVGDCRITSISNSTKAGGNKGGKGKGKGKGKGGKGGKKGGR